MRSVDRNKYQIQIPLPPKIDPTVTMMTVEEKPDVTYSDIGGCKEQVRRSSPLCLYWLGLALLRLSPGVQQQVSSAALLCARPGSALPCCACCQGCKDWVPHDGLNGVPVDTQPGLRCMSQDVACRAALLQLLNNSIALAWLRAQIEKMREVVELPMQQPRLMLKFFKVQGIFTAARRSRRCARWWSCPCNNQNS